MAVTTDTTVNKLVINKLTSAQYKQAQTQGKISDTELYLVTDEPSYTKAEVDTKLTDGSVTKLGKSDVGSGIKPIHLTSGTPSESTSDVGDSKTPMYLDGGEMTACEYTLGDACELTKSIKVSSTSTDAEAPTAKSVYTALTDGTVTQVGTSDVGDTTTPVCLVGGVPTVCDSYYNKAQTEGLIDRRVGGAFRYGLSFDSTLFATDPEGCLTYTDDCASYTRVTRASDDALASADCGSWDDKNPLLASMFYATFDGTTMTHVLDPNDLTKELDTGADMSSVITTQNVMLVIPTLYSKRGAGGISLSSRPTDGTAYAHTYDGHTYKYLAIGVYQGTIIDNKLMSVSGQKPTQSKTRAAFRNAAKANGAGYMLTNWHVRQLIRDLTVITGKSFDSQRTFGQGYTTGGSSTTPDGLESGLCNQLGRFAGNVTGVTDACKCLIENPWADKWEFVDDITTWYDTDTTVYDQIYIGQHLNVTDYSTDADIKANMTRLGTFPSTGDINAHWSDSIDTTEVGWGRFASETGSDSAGLCDAHWYDTGARRLAVAGGSSNDGSGCGVSALSLNNVLSFSCWDFGARPVLVFD